MPNRLCLLPLPQTSNKNHTRCLFEATFGGMSPYAARRLRRLAREATASSADPTDYSKSPSARSFLPFYTQRLSGSCVLDGAKAIQKSIKRRVARRTAAMAQ